ncbi:MAG: flagellar hook-associated protein FlgL [Planctomycetota bacterium]
MGLRITQAMSANRALFDLTRNALRLQQTREQLSTGRRINRPSDDPVTFLRMQPKRNEKQLVALFQDNAHLAGDVLGLAASSMEDAVQVLSRAKELAVQGANGTMGEADRRLLGKTARQLVTEMLALGNGKLGDRYLFSGTATGTMPFEMVSDASGTFVRYHGDDNPVTVEIAAGVEVDVTSSGRSMFLPGARTRTSFEGATGARPGVGTDSGRGLHTLSVEWTGLSGLPAGLSAGTTPATILGDHAWTITAGPPDTISIDGGPQAQPIWHRRRVQVQVGTTGETVSLRRSATRRRARRPARCAPRPHELGRKELDGDRLRGNEPAGRHASTGAMLNVDSTGILRSRAGAGQLRRTYDAFNVLASPGRDAREP